MHTPRLRAIALGITLGEHAASLGLTQEQVAEKCGFAQGTVSRVFAGKYPAKSEVLCAIAEAIGCEIKIEPLTSPERGEKHKIMNFYIANISWDRNSTPTAQVVYVSAEDERGRFRLEETVIKDGQILPVIGGQNIIQKGLECMIKL